MAEGKLFVVPTPVGNLNDMTPRAVKVLKTCDAILAEDTRVTGKLLEHFGIKNRLGSFHKFNEHEQIKTIVDRLKNGERIALVSDAGTPGISDPGFLLTRACRENDIEIETLPGPTAFVPALVNSGLPCDRFYFEGFLPQKKGRSTRLQFLAALELTFVLYESPMRVVKTLQQLIEVCGEERNASVSREISKIYNQTVNGTLKEIYQHFLANTPKGEFVIVVEGAHAQSHDNKTHKNKYKQQ